MADGSGFNRVMITCSKYQRILLCSVSLPTDMAPGAIEAEGKKAISCGLMWAVRVVAKYAIR